MLRDFLSEIACANDQKVLDLVNKHRVNKQLLCVSQPKLTNFFIKLEKLAVLCERIVRGIIPTAFGLFCG